MGALALSVYLGTQAVGTLAGGFFADRVDRSRLLAWLTSWLFPPISWRFPLPPESFQPSLWPGLRDSSEWP